MPGEVTLLAATLYLSTAFPLKPPVKVLSSAMYYVLSQGYFLAWKKCNRLD